MRKIVKLIQNENKKEMKKISTKIFIIAAIISIILAMGLVMLIKWETTLFTDDTDNNWKEYVQAEIDGAKGDLKIARENKDEQTAVALEAQIKVKQYAIDNDINIYESYTDWKTPILIKIMDEETTLNIYKYQKNNETANVQEEKETIDEKITKQTKKVEELYDILKREDFEAYMRLQKNELDENLKEKNISKEEYDLNLEILNLKEKYEIGKTNAQNSIWIIEVVDEIQKIKEELRTNFNSDTRKLLTYEQRQEKENTLKIDLYRLENNIPPISQTFGETNYRSYFDMISESFSMTIVSILVIMIAGAAISTEYSKGTIKFLVMTPNKRWKILLAKLINAIIIMLIITIVLSLLTIVIGNIAYKDYETYPYLYVKNGEVHSLNHTAYTILRFLAEDIDIFVYLLFALMLSVITRNTAVSIGVSIATFLGSGIAMNILNMFVKSDWVKFIPFNNMGLVDKIFTNTTTLMTSDIVAMMNNVSLYFSLSVLGVCAILMLITMFDSFNKRDIK